MGNARATRTTLATVSYGQAGASGASYKQEIYRPKGQTPQARLTELRTLIPKCKAYRVNIGTFTYALAVSPLTFPAVGDDTLSIRAGSKVVARPVSDDIVYVVIGDVIARFDSISGPTGVKLAPAAFEKAVRQSVSRLTNSD